MEKYGINKLISPHYWISNCTKIYPELWSVKDVSPGDHTEIPPKIPWKPTWRFLAKTPISSPKLLLPFLIWKYC
jgi:hypothetical protein